MAENSNKNVYFVVNAGEVLYASFDISEAKDFCYSKMKEDYAEAQNDLMISEPNEKQEADIEFVAGYDSGDYQIKKTKYSKLLKEDTIVVNDDEFETSDILGKLETSNDGDDSLFYDCDELY